ncbi:hypothetical protein BN126_2334 [Cronobacter sakazakii 680]|nr:hypothetical protein BN126_2334 [Cronobacter sakazakii 680]
MPPGLGGEAHSLLLGLLQESIASLLVRQSCSDLLNLLVKLLRVFLAFAYGVLPLKVQESSIRVCQQIIADGIKLKACFLGQCDVSPLLSLCQRANIFVTNSSDCITNIWR